MRRMIIQTARGEVHIRPARPEDWKVYRTLRLQALGEHPTAFGADYEDNLLHPDEYWKRRVTTEDEREALFFAEQEEALIGMTGIYRDLGKKTRYQAGVWGVYVRPKWRGLYLAERLIEVCLDWACGKGIVIARLGVATDNLSAIRCYERCGFHICGTKTKAIYFKGQYIDEYLMERALQESQSEDSVIQET